MARPHLTTHRPSPTTALYTVSTASPRDTLPAKTLHFLLLLLRLTVFTLTILTLALKCLPHPTNPPENADQPSDSTSLSSLLNTSPLLTALHTILHNNNNAYTSWTYILPPLILLLYLTIHRYHTEESLLALRTLGLQTSTSSSTYLPFGPFGGSSPSRRMRSTRFIPTSQIRDIFIHEAFLGFEVRYYLAIIVEGEGEVVVVFPRLLPGREVVEEVWRGARGCLFEEPGGNGSGSGSGSGREGKR